MPESIPVSPIPVEKQTETQAPPIVVEQPGQPPQVFSPSPEPGQPSPRRREADTKSYTIQWSAVGVGLLVWSISFFNEIADLSWPELTTLKFVASHVAQVLGVFAAVIGAKQIPNRG